MSFPLFFECVLTCFLRFVCCKVFELLADLLGLGACDVFVDIDICINILLYGLSRCYEHVMCLVSPYLFQHTHRPSKIQGLLVPSDAVVPFSHLRTARERSKDLGHDTVHHPHACLALSLGETVLSPNVTKARYAILNCASCTWCWHSPKSLDHLHAIGSLWLCFTISI